MDGDQEQVGSVMFQELPVSVPDISSPVLMSILQRGAQAQRGRRDMF